MRGGNRHIVAIEGDETINPELLRVITQSDLGIDVVFVSRDDGLCPESLAVEILPDELGRVVLALEMAILVANLKQVVADAMRRIEEALDTINVEPDQALDAIEQMERELRAARAAILREQRRAMLESDDGNADKDNN